MERHLTIPICLLMNIVLMYIFIKGVEQLVRRQKEIHVNDLVIKANHVSFEPPERKEPFFGSEKPDLWKGTEQKKREELETEHENEGYDKEEFDGERRRPPFFWI